MPRVWAWAHGAAASATTDASASQPIDDFGFMICASSIARPSRLPGGSPAVAAAVPDRLYHDCGGPSPGKFAAFRPSAVLARIDQVFLSRRFPVVGGDRVGTEGFRERDRSCVAAFCGCVFFFFLG